MSANYHTHIITDDNNSVLVAKLSRQEDEYFAPETPDLLDYLAQVDHIEHYDLMIDARRFMDEFEIHQVMVLAEKWRLLFKDKPKEPILALICRDELQLNHYSIIQAYFTARRHCGFTCFDQALDWMKTKRLEITKPNPVNS